MARVIDDLQVAMRDCRVERNSRGRGAHQVVAPLDDLHGDRSWDASGGSQQLTGFQPRIVLEVVSLQDGEFLTLLGSARIAIGPQRRQAVLPRIPGIDRTTTSGLPPRTEKATVPANGARRRGPSRKATSLRKICPRLRCYTGRASLTVEPFLFPLGKQTDTAKNECCDGARMTRPIGEGEGGAPRAAKDRPRFARANGDASECFNVGHEVPRSIVFEAETGRGVAATALIECDDAPLGEIEGFESAATESAAWAAVKEDGGSAVCGPVDFVVDAMSTGYF
jgi:hypothetical protein